MLSSTIDVRRYTISSDDGIYVLKTKHPIDGFEYRICRLMAVDNIYNDPQARFAAFGDKEVYDNFDTAITVAVVEDDTAQTEYGVCIIEDFKDNTWFELMNEEQK
jgi:hypothetical protein